MTRRSRVARRAIAASCAALVAALATTRAAPARPAPATRSAMRSAAPTTTLVHPPTTVPPSLAGTIPRLIEQLADPAADRRDAAVSQLSTMGWPARAALNEAANSANAQRRQLARAILSRLPLYAAGDAPPVRENLKAYQRASIDLRPGIALGMLALNTPATDAGFVRVLAEERDSTVLWAIVTRVAPADAVRLNRGRTDATGADPATTADRGPLTELSLDDDALALPVRYLIATAIAAQTPDDALVTREYARVLAGLSDAPTGAAPALARMATVLCAAAQARDDSAGEIELRRRVALLTPPASTATDDLRARNADTQRDALTQTGVALLPDTVAPTGQGKGVADDATAEPATLSTPVLRYVATRLRYGMTANAADDLRAMGVDVDGPAARFMLAVLNAAPTDATPATTGPATAPASSLATLAATVDTDELCAALTMIGATADRWDLAASIARPEIERLDALIAKQVGGVKAMQADPTRPRGTARIAMRRMRLGLVLLSAAQARHDDAAIAAARQIAATVVLDGADAQDQWGFSLAERTSGVLAAPLIAAARRAERDGDDAMLGASIDALARLSPLVSEDAIDAIYLLERHGRRTEADEIFAELIAPLDKALDDFVNLPANVNHIENPDMLNEIAWTSARTGRNVERAYRLVARANAANIAPVSGMLDTQAECAFRIGHAAEAVQLERRAAQMANAEGEDADPAFLARQLARFTAGPKPGDRDRPLPSQSWGE